ncbi:DUF1501 domain-containing protein [bacterium]|nr:DUF1501 domain-containing protein [bacterium]
MWIAESVVKCTITGGVTDDLGYDDFGYDIIENQIHMHDLHATMCP